MRGSKKYLVITNNKPLLSVWQEAKIISAFLLVNF